MLRKRINNLKKKFIVIFLVTLSAPAHAQDKNLRQSLHVAVASNFLFPLKEIARRFQAETGIDVVTSSGSTGTLYAQISNGAPYDIFLSADKERPRLLVEKGYAVTGSRVTYAYGQLVLWGNIHQVTISQNSKECLVRLKKSGRLAIANPQTAPYGAAARQSLQHLGLWENIRPRTVYGNNIAHTFQFVHSGNVDFGIVALSEYLRKGQDRPGCAWTIPGEYYTPLEQQAVILKRTEKKSIAAAFLAFITNKINKETLIALGYGSH